MPLYRFAVNDGRHLDLTYAIEQASDTVAVKEAHRALAEMIADLPAGARAEYHIAIKDAAGAIIYEASLTFRGETAKARGGRRI